MPHARAIFLILALLLPTSASADPASFAPTAVAAIITNGPDSILTWAPGEVIADAYLLFGLNPDTAPVPLGTFTVSNAANDAMQALVPSGYEDYGVSGLLNGTESPMMTTTAAAGAACIVIYPTEPNLYVRCIPIVGQVGGP